jgi:hypothetical protein
MMEQRNLANQRVNGLTRINVLHSGWSAIFDKTVEIDGSGNLEITLPRRDYCYMLNAGVLTENGEVGTVEGFIQLCC